MYITPCASTDTFWQIVSDIDTLFPPGVFPYKTDRDYVGPQSFGALCSLTSRTTWGVDFNKAAYRHDYHYAVGGTDTDRLEADLTFYREMVEAIHETYPKGSGFKAACLRFLANRRAEKYFKLVRVCGSNFYYYHPVEDTE